MAVRRWPCMQRPDPFNARLARAGLAVVALGASVAPLDFALSIAFPALADAFALDTRQIRWVAVCYVLTYGVLMLWTGALGDRVGHLRVFAVGLLLSITATVLCAMAPTYGWLLAGRVLMGLGVAFALSCSPALAMSLFDEGRRTAVLSAYGGLFALAGLLAPLVGGWAMGLMGWPGVFWFRVPVYLLALLGLPLLAQARAGQAVHGVYALHAVHAVQAVHGAHAVHAVGAAQVQAAKPQHASMLAPLVQPVPGGVLHAAAAAPVSVAWWSAALWRLPGFARVNVASMLLQFCSFALVLVMPFYLVRQGDWHPGAIGLMLGSWAAGSMLGSALAARWVRARGLASATLWGVALGALGLLGLVLWPAQPTGAAVPWLVATLAVQGLGVGVFQVAYADQVVAALPAHQRGVAGSLTMVTRTGGVVLGALVWAEVLQRAGEGDFMRGHRAVFGSAALLAAGLAATLWRAGRQPAAVHT